MRLSLFILFFVTSSLFCSTTEITSSPSPLPSTSAPEQLSTLFADDAFLVGGKISPLSGQLVLHQTDLVARGAQDILLQRFFLSTQIPEFPDRPKPYDGSDLKKLDRYRQECFAYYLNCEVPWWDLVAGKPPNWSSFLHSRLVIDHHILYVSLPGGAVLQFSGKKNSAAALITPLPGISNGMGDRPTALADMRNVRVERGGKEVSIFCPDGRKLFYLMDQSSHYCEKLKGKCYLLQKETLPNGKILRYSYGKGRCCTNKKYG